MDDHLNKNNEPARQTAPGWVRPTVDYGPLGVFFAAYLGVGKDLILATGFFMAATVAAIAISYWFERRIPKMLLVTAAVVLMFGGLTVVFDDERFIKMKPTIVQGIFAVVLLGGLAIKKPLLKPLLSAAWHLTDKGWNVLTMRFGLFFAVMAVINEAVWRTQSTDFWVNFKVFGAIGLTLIFTVAQVPLLSKYQIVPDEKSGD